MRSSHRNISYSGVPGSGSLNGAGLTAQEYPPHDDRKLAKGLQYKEYQIALPLVSRDIGRPFMFLRPFHLGDILAIGYL